LAVVAGAALVLGPLAGLVAVSGRGDRLVEEALPGALEAVARGLRSGASLVQSIHEAGAATPGRLGHELVAISTAVRNGGALVVAIDAWGERHALGGVRLAVSALGLGAETGGAHARALDGVAATIRSRLAVSREVRALSAQARLSGLVITVAPLGFAVLASATDERTATFLLRTPLGLVCLAAGLGLDGLAALWMHRLAKVEQ
jgi:tight adherence protein B